MADEFKDALVKDVTERLKEIFKDGLPVHIMPNTDLVPVIRCKDCKYWDREADSPKKHCDNYGGYWFAYDYCSRGERREDG